MSNNTGSIEQTRTQCLVVCDWLETVFKEMRDQLKREIAISTKKLNENMARSMKAFYEENAARNWLIKLLHPLKIVINFFAMTVFHIDHEFLDFSVPEDPQQGRYHLPADNTAVRAASSKR